MSETVFVTGANGRVGLPLVRALVAQGHQVVGLARSESKAALVREAGATCLVGELHDASVLAEGTRQAQVIYHLAGGLRGPGGQTPDAINHQGTLSLIEAIPAGGPLRALVFTSSVAVYGDRSGLWVEEDVPPYPNTDYGRSKADAEAALLQARTSRALPTRIVRLAAVYGPGFPFMMADAIRAGRAWLPGEGRNFVPVIHIDDAVTGLLLAAERGEDGQIYNLSDPSPLPLKAFYGHVQRHVGGKPVHFWSTWVPSYLQERLARVNERVSDRIGHAPRFTVDNLRMFTASSRTRVDLAEKQLGMSWRYPSADTGLAATLGDTPGA